MAWHTYRMYRKAARGINASWGRGSTAVSHLYLDEHYSPTRITFRARNDEEATRKGDKFWRDAELGIGSFIMLKE